MDPDSRGVRRGTRKGKARGTGRLPLVVTVTDERGRRLRAAALANWLTRVAPRSARGEVVVALVPDRHIRRLNRDYRRKDAATDVLSFPAPAGFADPSSLGDIAIATGVALRQAREAGHSYADELKVLALHGLLHLIGYDHHSRTDRGRMARVERRLRAKGGLRLGLIERAHASGRVAAKTPKT